MLAATACQPDDQQNITGSRCFLWFSELCPSRQPVRPVTEQWCQSQHSKPQLNSDSQQSHLTKTAFSILNTPIRSQFCNRNSNYSSRTEQGLTLSPIMSEITARGVSFPSYASVSPSPSTLRVGSGLNQRLSQSLLPLHWSLHGRSLRIFPAHCPSMLHSPLRLRKR